MAKGASQFNAVDKDGNRCALDVQVVSQFKDLVVAQHDKDGACAVVRTYSPTEKDTLLLSAWDRNGNFAPVGIRPPALSFGYLAMTHVDEEPNGPAYMSDWFGGKYQDDFDRGSLSDDLHPWDGRDLDSPIGAPHNQYELEEDPGRGPAVRKKALVGTGKPLVWGFPTPSVAAYSTQAVIKIAKPGNFFAYHLGFSTGIYRYDIAYIIDWIGPGEDDIVHWMRAERFLFGVSQGVTDSAKPAFSEEFPYYDRLTAIFATADNGVAGSMYGELSEYEPKISVSHTFS